MIHPKLKKEIEKMVHQRSGNFFIKLMTKLAVEKAKKKKYDNLN